MPRKPRVISSTGIYHIILRSVNQQIIFEENADYLKFLFILSDAKSKYDVDIYAYCIMDNHIHLLLNSPPDALSHFFQSLGTRFVRWYNTKYRRSGHLFQERFHSRIVENFDCFLNTLIYIHNNPVRAGSCRFPSEYRWSSFNAFYGEKNDILNISFSYEICGSKEHLLKFFSHHSSDLSIELAFYKEDHPLSKIYLTDEQALALFRELTDLSSIHEIAKLNKCERNELVRTLQRNNIRQSQIARLTGLSVTTIHRICR